MTSNLASPSLNALHKKQRGPDLDFDKQVKEIAASMQLGAHYHQRSGGHRATGWKIALRNLEALNQKIIERDGLEIPLNQEAVDLWLSKGERIPGGLADSVRALQACDVPFAQHVWKLLVSSLYEELKTAVAGIPSDSAVVPALPPCSNSGCYTDATRRWHHWDCALFQHYKGQPPLDVVKR